MKIFYQKKISRIFTASVVLFSIPFSGCLSTSTKGEGTKKINLAAPSSVMIEADLDIETSLDDLDHNEWLALAQKYYDEKKFSKALRAALNSLDKENSVEARQLIMLSTINITNNYSKSFSNNSYIDDDEKVNINNRLTRITTAINSPIEIKD